MSLSPEQFARSLGDQPLERLHLADLYLACACAAGDPRALVAFEQQLMPQVRSHVARLDTSPAFVGEVEQRLRERLLVGTPESPPRIATYSGRGPLGGWLRVAALRVAHNLQRGAKPELDVDGPLRARLAQPGPDPEMAYIKRRYGWILRGVIEETLRKLPREDRTLLRLHLVDRLTVEQVGKICRVHASTVSRRIARARAELIDNTRARLRRELALDEQGLESLLVVLESGVDVTLSRVLETES